MPRRLLDIVSMVRLVKNRAEGDKELDMEQQEEVVQSTIYTLLLAATIGPPVMLQGVHIVRNPN